MTISQIAFRSMKKNIKNYFLYFIAIIFSTALYYSFVTLQYSDSIAKLTSTSTKINVAFEVSSYLLLFIVILFVVYANNLFIRQRSKEIGLFQLIGISKLQIMRMLSIENLFLWVGAIVLGIIGGFLSSRIVTLILLKLLQVDKIIKIEIYPQAIIQTMIVFALLYLFITVQIAWKVKRSNLLALFQDDTKQDVHIKQIGVFQMLLGVLGIVFIILGYYYSSVLFTSANSQSILIRMGTILFLTIFGTFLVFRYSIAFIFNAIRKSKKGHLSVNDVLASAPIMHRMKSNAKSLTLITVLTGLALAILSLSYISYYSIDKQVEMASPFDYQMYNEQYKKLDKAFDDAVIRYEKTTVHIATGEINIKYAIKNPNSLAKSNEILLFNVMPIRDAEKLFPDMKLGEGEVAILGERNSPDPTTAYVKGKKVTILNGKEKKEYEIKYIEEKNILPNRATIADQMIVGKATWDALYKANQSITTLNKQTGYTVNKKDQSLANDLYNTVTSNGKVKIKEKNAKGVFYERIIPSKQDVKESYTGSLGIVIFTTGFLGLAFLLSTGSILYFKQMAEAQTEKASYTTMRKIGFTTSDIMRGVYAKQLFSFGLPLLIGMLHSYFAVKSGWQFFGSELAAPLIITMSIYAVLYILFALLSILYYRKVVNSSL